MIKKTKVVCTVGPSTDGPGVLEAMIAAGMDVARFNFSHGSHRDHARRIAQVRAAAGKLKRHVALMLDTRGPEMRLGKVDGQVSLTAGQTFVLTAEEVLGTAERVTVSHRNLPREVYPGCAILLADGLIKLVVGEVAGDDIVTVVANSGVIGSNKRVAVPGVAISLPPLSEQDVADVLFGVEQKMDIVAASFIQRAEDVVAIRELLAAIGANTAIIAKIETTLGVENTDEIVAAADGVMVARGDLGIEMPAEELPLIQKKIIRKCNQAGKPVITATQMLESMINNPRPTRAEACDVANAIMDGSDAVMLSGETAQGLYPLEAVQTMASIAVRTEKALHNEALLQGGLATGSTTTDAISQASVAVARKLGASAVITATESGFTARMTSRYRPSVPIVAVTPYEETARLVQLLWGVFPVVGERDVGAGGLVDSVIESSLRAGMVKEGELVVVTAGVPRGTTGATNFIRVQMVGEALLSG